MIIRRFPAILLFLFCSTYGWAEQPEETATEKPSGDKSATEPKEVPKGADVSFAKDIKPILRDKCSHCHNAETLPRQVSFESRELAFSPNHLGQLYFNPGNPGESLIMKALNHPEFHEKKMPMVGPAPTREEIALLKKWIKEGAEWPMGPEGKIEPPFYAKE